MWIFQRVVLSVFLLNIFNFTEATEVSVPRRPDLFKSQTSGFLGTCRRNLRLIKLYAAGHEMLIERVTGQRFIADETFLMPAPTEEGGMSEDKDVKTIQGWIDRYKEYPKHMAKLEDALGRYLGEDLTKDHAPGDVRDPKTDSARQNGRIKILKQTSVDSSPLRTAWFQFWRPKDSERTSREVLELPVTIQLPRAPTRSGDKPGEPGYASLLSKRDLRDKSEIASFIRNDERESHKILVALAKREIEQAEIFVRLRVFLDAFPEDANQKLRLRLALAEKKSTAEGSAEQDLGKERESSLVDLYEQISRLMTKSEELRPSERSLEVITTLIKLSDDRSIGLGQTRNWVERAKTYTRWVWAWEAAISKPLKRLQSPFLTYTLAVLVFSSTVKVTTSAVVGVVSFVTSFRHDDPLYKKDKADFEMFSQLKIELADPAVNYPDFYERYRSYAQATFSDEAVKIAFQKIDGSRTTTEVTQTSDPHLAVARLADFSTQAAEIVRRHDILLKGSTENKIGNIPALEARLKLRDDNVKLSKKIAQDKSNALESNLPPVIEAPK